MSRFFLAYNTFAFWQNIFFVYGNPAMYLIHASVRVGGRICLGVVAAAFAGLPAVALHV